MGKGGQNDLQGSKDIKAYSWTDIRDHDKRNDKWIVVNNEIYDITRWSRRHPGGSRVISHYAGQDATDAFRAFHNDLGFVQKYLKPIHIGTLKPEERNNTELQSDFRELRKTAEKMNLFKPNMLFFACHLAHILMFELLAYLTMYYFGTSWIPYLTSLMFYTIVQAQTGWLQHDFGHVSVFKNYANLDHVLHHFTMGFIKGQVGWLQHDFGHLSVFHNSTLDHLLHHLTIGFIKGASAQWWNHMHYQHHAKPNVMDKDPDVRVEKLFVVGEHMPVKVAKEGKSSVPFNWQHRYFFIVGPPLLFPVYFQFMLIRHVVTRRAWVDMAFLAAFFFKFLYLYVPLLGIGQTIVYYILMRMLESHWFTWVSQSNHIPMEIDEDHAEAWLPLQMHATCDIEKSFFNDWFTGHLNFQIEHHLFPTMPRHNLYKIAPLVKSLCDKHGLKYQVKPLLQSFKDIVSSLKHSGELWYSTYNQYQ